MTITIEVRYDRVTILGTTIMRPVAMSVSQWLKFWEAVKELT